MACDKCFKEPCICGAEYEDWSIGRIRKHIKMLQEVLKKKEMDEPSFLEDEKPYLCKYCLKVHSGNCKEYAKQHHGVFQDGTKIRWDCSGDPCHSNFENAKGQIFLVYCPSCEKENLLDSIEHGKCAYCGYTA